MRKASVALAVFGLLAALATDSVFAAPRGGGAPRGGSRPGAGAPGGLTPGGGGTRISPPSNLGPGGGRAPGTNLNGPAAPGGLSGRTDSPVRSTPNPRVHDIQGFLDGRTPGTHTTGDARATAASRATAYSWSGAAQKPFTPAWYKDHPRAWQATHPHADLFVAAAAADLARWLAVPVVYAGAGGSSVVYSTEVIAAAPATESGTVAASDTPAAASELAQSGGQPADGAEWMSIGVFALSPAGGGEATRVIQLSVSREGTVRGTHVDLVSDDAQEVRGAVNKQDLRIAFTIGSSSKVVFQGPLGELTKPEGRITAYFPDGKTAAWRMVQVKQPGA